MIDSLIRICFPAACVTMFATHVSASTNTNCLEIVELTPDPSFVSSGMNDQGMIVGTSNNQMAVHVDGQLEVITTLQQSEGGVINDSGQAVGTGSVGVGLDDRLIRRNADGSVEILAIVTGSGGWSYLTGMNESGSIVGNYSKGSGSSQWTAFMWTEDAGLEFIAPDLDFSYITAIDADGRACGYVQGNEIFTAATWTDGVMTTYEHLQDMDGFSRAVAFADDGRILMSARPDDAFIYFWYDQQSGERQDVHEFPSQSFSILNTVSGNGNVAFSWRDGSGTPHAGRWTPESGFEQFTFDPLETITFDATGINDDGLVIGTSFDSPLFTRRAKIWRPSTQPTTLETGIETIFDSSIARFINRSGQIQVDTTFAILLLDPRCLGDVDGDGAVGVEDLLQVVADWGTDGDGPCGSDGNDDGTVGVDDLLDVIANWNGCG